MDRFREIYFKTHKEQMPLFLSLVAAAKEHGASASEFRKAAEIVCNIIEEELLGEPRIECWDQIEAALKSIEKDF